MPPVFRYRCVLYVASLTPDGGDGALLEFRNENPRDLPEFWEIIQPESWRLRLG